MKRRYPMKRTYWKRKPRAKLKPVSDKRKELNRKAAGLRRRLVNEAGCCMNCGYSSKNPNPAFPIQCSKLSCHEIWRGSAGRSQSLDKDFAILVLCSYCNCHEFDDASQWPQARQLCLLQYRRPDLYNLKAFNKLVNERAPNRITQDEVDEFCGSIVLF